MERIEGFDDVAFDILWLLDFKSLLAISAVSRNWKRLATSEGKWKGAPLRTSSLETVLFYGMGTAFWWERLYQFR